MLSDQASAQLLTCAVVGAGGTPEVRQQQQQLQTNTLAPGLRPTHLLAQLQTTVRAPLSPVPVRLHVLMAPATRCHAAHPNAADLLICYHHSLSPHPAAHCVHRRTMHRSAASTSTGGLIASHGLPYLLLGLAGCAGSSLRLQTTGQADAHASPPDCLGQRIGLAHITRCLASRALALDAVMCYAPDPDVIVT